MKDLFKFDPRGYTAYVSGDPRRIHMLVISTKPEPKRASVAGAPRRPGPSVHLQITIDEKSVVDGIAQVFNLRLVTFSRVAEKRKHETKFSMTRNQMATAFRAAFGDQVTDVRLARAIDVDLALWKLYYVRGRELILRGHSIYLKDSIIKNVAYFIVNQRRSPKPYLD